MQHQQLQLQLAVKPILYELQFNQHQGMVPRFGWLKKGFNLISTDENAFSRDNLHLTIGMTPTMVKSLQYWLKAFKLVEEYPNGAIAPTPFGYSLLSDTEGSDPFLEDIESFWRLHWKLLSPSAPAVWWWMFNKFNSVNFSRKQMIAELIKWFQEISSKTSEKTIASEYNAILKFYCGYKSRHFEEELNQPFTQMNLLKESSSFNQTEYSWIFGHKSGLTSKVIAEAAIEFAQQEGYQSAIAIAHLTYNQGSPGRVFKIGEQFIAEALVEAGMKIEEDENYRLFLQLEL